MRRVEYWMNVIENNIVIKTLPYIVQGFFFIYLVRKWFSKDDSEERNKEDEKLKELEKKLQQSLNNLKQKMNEWEQIQGEHDKKISKVRNSLDSISAKQREEHWKKYLSNVLPEMDLTQEEEENVQNFLDLLQQNSISKESKKQKSAPVQEAKDSPKKSLAFPPGWPKKKLQQKGATK